MRWFRRQLNLGSWLALIALAANLTLTFGHIHGLAGSARDQSVAVKLASALSAADRGQHSPSDNHPDYLCPICMAATAMGNALASTPPALQVEFAAAKIEQSIQSFRQAPQRPRAAFNSRAPPIA